MGTSLPLRNLDGYIDGVISCLEIERIELQCVCDTQLIKENSKSENITQFKELCIKRSKEKDGNEERKEDRVKTYAINAFKIRAENVYIHLKGCGTHFTIFNSTLTRDLCRVGGGGETLVQIAQLKLLPVRIGVGLLIWNLPIRLLQSLT